MVIRLMTCTYTRDEIKRLAIMGFELAMKRSKKLCCVDKANVLESSRLWRETVQGIEKNYPEVDVSYEFVDAVAMRLVQWPNSYDVLITENLLEIYLQTKHQLFLDQWD